MEGRSWVERSDVFAIAPMVLRHRLILSYEANKITVEDVVGQILQVFR